MIYHQTDNCSIPNTNVNLLFIPVTQSWILSIITPVFSVTSFSDPSEIILICWFAAHETCIIFINDKSYCAAFHIIVESMKQFEN